MQLNNCDGVLGIYLNTLLGQQISQHTAISMSQSALDLAAPMNANQQTQKFALKIKLTYQI